MQVDKEEIRARNDIVEVVGAVVQLRRRGRTWTGLCPFHTEKTASFHVDPITQTFRCYGCGASGDVFTFVERHENMSFLEAAEHLGRRAGVELARKGGPRRPPGERDALFDANAIAAAHFRSELARSRQARDYLTGRGLLPATVEQFQVGYAPDSWDSLTTHFVARRYDLKVAAAAGVVHKGRTGDYYDAFRGRTMFPILDDQQRVVGFGGRAMGDEQPKYLNTGETPVFSKSRLLYGLPFARKRIAEAGQTLLMEGYTDVIAAHQAGITNAVATLGTALTSDHAKKLARLAPGVTLIFDADSAGIRATLRAAQELEAASITVRIVALPEGEDPDSLIRSGHSDRLERAIADAVSRVQFKLDRAQAETDHTTAAGRQALIRQVIGILASVPSRTERDPYIESVWQLHPLSVRGPGLAKEQLHRDAEEAAARQTSGVPPSGPDRQTPGAAGGERSTQGTSPRSTTSPGAITATARTTEARAECQILRAVTDPMLRRDALAVVVPDDMITEPARGLIDFMIKHAAQLPDDEAELMRVIRSTSDERFSQAVMERLQESYAVASNEPMTVAVLAGAVRTLRRHRQELLNTELARILQSKSELTEEDRGRVRELHALLAQLKGSAGAG